MTAKIEQTLTKNQQEVVDYEGEEVLVRGIAGSGKTLVMLRKARLTAEKYPDQTVAVFSYGRPLKNASTLLMEDLNLPNLKIHTFHGWAMSSYYKIMRKKFWMVQKNSDFLGTAIDKLKKIEKHRFVQDAKYKEFLKDEISWIKGKGIERLEEYLEANRRGRGSLVRVTTTDRKFLFKVYSAYNDEKDYRLDYDDFGLLFSKNLNKIKDDLKIDHIFIDEAQDLQQVQLLILRKLARKSFFVAADKGQKIYKTSFAWKDIGLNIQGGRTKILKESFRSTKPIIQLANSLQRNDSVVNDEEYVATELPTRDGPNPSVIKCPTWEVQDKEIAKAVETIQKDNAEATIGILARNKKSLFRVRYAIRAVNIEPEIVQQDEGNPYAPGVKLCTLHSSKGLEFDYVLVIDLNEPDLDEDTDTDEYWEYERRLLYVSITRACTYLQLYFYSKGSRLLNELDEDLYEKVTV